MKDQKDKEKFQRDTKIKATFKGKKNPRHCAREFERLARQGGQDLDTLDEYDAIRDAGR